MGKYYKTYTRNKKESNISQPLRYSFLKSIFIEGLSVKNVPLIISRPQSSGKCTIPQPKSSLARQNEPTYFSSFPTIWLTKSPLNSAAGRKLALPPPRRSYPLLTKTPKTALPSPRLGVTSTTVLEIQLRSLARLVGAITI